MNENFDILPEGAADAYEEYLRNLKDRLDTLMGQTNNITYSFEGHDRNRFTEKIENSVKALAGQVQGISEGVAEITHQMLQKLEEKNEIVGSRKQEDYINQLHSAAEQLSDIEPYREVELDGAKAFGEEEQEQIALDLRDLTDEWQDAILQMQEKAHELSEENEQNELSGVYEEITGLFTSFLNQMGEQMESIGSHMQDIAESHRERKASMKALAAEGTEEFLAQLNRGLEDAASDFKGFTF